MAKTFKVDAISKSNTKYIFSLKYQMHLGILHPENYGNEVRIQNFLLPGFIKGIDDLVKLMGYDLENPKDAVLPKMNHWALTSIALGIFRSYLTLHYCNSVSNQPCNAEFRKITNECNKNIRIYVIIHKR